MLQKILKVIFLFLFIAQFGAIYYLFTEINNLKSQLTLPDTIVQKNFPVTNQLVEKTVNEECGVDCQNQIEAKVELKVSEAVSKISIPTSNEKITYVASPQTSYIPLGTTSSSTSTDWFTIGDTSAFIDLKNDFSEDAYVTFEASLKVAHGNGSAYVRLWDDTNKIAVNGSEISTSNNAEFQHVKSGRIYLWRGNNEYKIQLKSLNGFEVTLTSGKVKVVY